MPTPTAMWTCRSHCPPGASALALGGLLMDAQELLGRRVDVVTEPALHPALRERVLASCIAL